MIIVLPAVAAAKDSCYRYITAAGHHTSVMHGNASPADLLALAQKKSVVVLVPVVMLSWHKVELPHGVGVGSPHLRAVLAGLLEDQLLGDVAELHLALAPVQTQLTAATLSVVWVCVCDAGWLRGHMQALDTLQIKVARVVPEFSPCGGPLQLHVVSSGDPLHPPQLFATGEAVGGVVRLPLSPAASALVAGLGAEQTQVVHADADLVEAARQLLPYQVNTLPVQQRWLQTVESSSWDLAQFDLASTGRTRLFKRLSLVVAALCTAPEWRIARWGVAVFVVANLAGLNILALREKAALNAQRAALKAVLVQTFPHVKVVVDAPLQMEREWASVRQAAGVASAQDIEPILSLLSQVVPDGKTPNSIEFVNQEARIKGLQLNPQQAAQLLALLKAKSYSVRADEDAIFMKQDIERQASK